MLYKNTILYDGKLIYNKFSINKKDNKIIIKSLGIKDNIIKLPIYNKYHGIDYYPVCFPLEYIILDNNVFNPYIILSSYSFQNNDIDFFYNLNKIININYKLDIINFNSLLDNSKLNLIKIINDNYKLDLITENILLEDFINGFWLNINIIKLYVIYVLIKFPNGIYKNHNISKKIQKICNNIKDFKYKLNNINYQTTLNEYIITKFKKSLKLSELQINNNYFIIIGGTGENTTSDIISSDTTFISKMIIVNIKKITKNIINIDNRILVYENYKWYHYYPTMNINKDYIIYLTFINDDFTNGIIKEMTGINDIHILKYYMIDNKLNNLIILSNYYTDIIKYIDDINILKSNSYDIGFFEYITKKYSNDESKTFEIIEILLNNPYKYNNYYLIESNYDYILYISIYNYEKILINNNNKFNELLHPTINNIIPYKMKNVYINILKLFQSLKNNQYDIIIYNQKFYTDFLHKQIIKILLGDYDCLISKLIKEMIPVENYKKFKDIIINNMLIMDISNKICWNTISSKLYYLKFYYNNFDIIFYQNRLNKNILPENFDNKIKKIIENPYEMYSYIKKESDFIKWTNFISDKIINLYNIPISLSSEDFNNIGKLIYLLFNIIEQNLNDISYKEFIVFCNTHSKLILDSTRINLKIKEYFQNLKFNINLGFLAKHLMMEHKILTFDDNKDQLLIKSKIIKLENELEIINKKYHKYKIKYINYKKNKDNEILLSETSND